MKETWVIQIRLGIFHGYTEELSSYGGFIAGGEMGGHSSNEDSMLGEK